MSASWKTYAAKAVFKPDETLTLLRRFLAKGIRKFSTPRDGRAWMKQAAVLRREALEKVYLRGYPRKWVTGKPRVQWGEVLRPHPSYRIRKLRYEVVPGHWSPALMYEPTRLKGKVPVVLNPNGHHAGGKAVIYKQARCINLAKRGMIALNIEYHGMGELRADLDHNNFAFMDFGGRAGVGLFYLNMRKGLDILLAHRNADRKRVAMTGLSGGGWQTITLGALDTRITCIIPVAGYNSFFHRTNCLRDLGDFEQSPTDQAQVIDYTHMTAMLAPRPTLQILNQYDDCCFKTPDAKPWIYDKIRPTFKRLGAADKFEFYSNLNPGTHNYDADNRSRMYRFINEQFGLPPEVSPDHDLPFEKELYLEPQLRCGLPAEQLTMIEMAYALARHHAHRHTMPSGTAQKRKLRSELTAVLRLPKLTAKARRVSGTATCGNYAITTGPHRVGATVIRKKVGCGALLTLADVGRQVYATQNPPGEHAVTAVVDLMGDGENQHNRYMQMLVQTTGRRVLGIRVAQVLAMAKWLAGYANVQRVNVMADGPHAAIAAALAAAIEPNRFDVLFADELPETLLRLFEMRIDQDAAQRSLCPDLLATADMPQILSLCRGVTLRKDGSCVPPRPLG